MDIKWGTSPHTIRTVTLTLYFSTEEYACPIWKRSVNAKKVDIPLNKGTPLITGCLKIIPISKLNIMSEIVPPHIRREERTKQLMNERRTMNGQVSFSKRLKLRENFLGACESLTKRMADERLEKWKEESTRPDVVNKALPPE